MDVQRQNGATHLAPSLRSRWDRIGQKPGGNAAPTYLFFAKRKGKPKETKKYIPISFKKEVTYWEEHKQNVFGHEPDGVRIYHYVQSFRIGEEITPQEAHEISMIFAESFGNREVLVATILTVSIFIITWLCVLMIWRAASSCIQYILRDKHGEGNPPTIPDHIRMEIARCLLPDIIAFCESEQGKREFEEWKKKRLDEVKEKEKVS